MKYIYVFLSILLSTTALADSFVNGYYKRNGIYVQPHFRSSPDISTFNNYNSWGNINPYTGRWGTSNPVTQEIYKSYRRYRPSTIYSILPYLPIAPIVGGIGGGGTASEYRNSDVPHHSPIYTIKK